MTNVGRRKWNIPKVLDSRKEVSRDNIQNNLVLLWQTIKEGTEVGVVTDRQAVMRMDENF